MAQTFFMYPSSFLSAADSGKKRVADEFSPDSDDTDKSAAGQQVSKITAGSVLTGAVLLQFVLKFFLWTSSCDI